MAIGAKQKISDLNPNPKNPRAITDAKLNALRAALLEFGDLGGFVYNRKSQQLVGGHQRAKLFDAKAPIVIERRFKKPTKVGTVAEGFVELNGERFKYREVYWDSAVEKAANIAANKGAGDWDTKLLADWFKDLDAIDFDLDLTMFDEDERAKYLGKDSKKGLIDDDEVPEKVAARTKLGQIWQLGSHRLMCGDSTNEISVGKLMNGEKADLWLTDPPYGVGMEAREKSSSSSSWINKDRVNSQISNDDKSLDEMKVFWKACAQAAHFATSDKAAYYWFACQGGDQMMMMMMLGEAEWQVEHELIWVKDQMCFGRADYHYKHEPIIYGWKRKCSHEWYGDRKQVSTFDCPRPKKSDLHPTMKPTELLERLLNNSSKNGQMVLDTFGGSGSTLIACEKTNRKCFMMELDPHYCDVIIERWEKFTGQKAKLLTADKQAKKSHA